MNEAHTFIGMLSMSVSVCAAWNCGPDTIDCLAQVLTNTFLFCVDA